MTNVEPDKWYLCVICPKCQEPIPFQSAPAPEEKPDHRARGVQLACPRCHTQHTYRGSEVLRLQGPKSIE